MYSKSFKAIWLAMRMLFQKRRLLAFMLVAYAALLAAIYLFVSTREATISQLLLTLVVVIAAPALFLVLQVASVSYTGSDSFGGQVRNGWKLLAVSLPVIGLTVLGVYGLGKFQNYPTTATTLRYLLAAVVAPMLAIQLWIATSKSGLRALLKSGRSVVQQACAPHSMLVYALGFLIFAVAPYLLLQQSMVIERAWLELSVLILRLVASALLVLFGWVITVGAISILNRT